MTDDARMDELLERVRRSRHTMGNDVPLWVEEQMDIAIDLLEVLWAGIWRCGLFSVIFAFVYDINAINSGAPFLPNPIGNIVAFGILGAVLGTTVGAWRSPGSRK